MKKIYLLAAFAVLGFSVVSCSSDDNEDVSVPENRFKTESYNGTMSFKEGDTIPVIDNITLTTEFGPGDDPIIIPPPPPPKP